ncbi:unnamed protein product [Closterium sp. Yama58-4]|nr:unnamed protein product [Closterium sp. Yama58-4]
MSFVVKSRNAQGTAFERRLASAAAFHDKVTFSPAPCPLSPLPCPLPPLHVPCPLIPLSPFPLSPYPAIPFPLSPYPAIPFPPVPLSRYPLSPCPLIPLSPFPLSPYPPALLPFCPPSSQAEKVRAAGGAEATACLLGVPLGGHNSSFQQGPAFKSLPPSIHVPLLRLSTSSFSNITGGEASSRALPSNPNRPPFMFPYSVYPLLLSLTSQAEKPNLSPVRLPFCPPAPLPVASQAEKVRAAGGAEATACLLGVPLGHNSSFLQGPAFAPPRIREAIWCGSTNSSTEEGKDLNDIRVLTDVGDVPVQEMRDCGLDDSRLMRTVSDSVRLVLAESPLAPLVLGGDHSISFPVVRAVSEHLGGQVDILHFDAHPDIYHAFEGNHYSHASPFARIMESGACRRLLQVGIRSINEEGRAQGRRFGVEQYEMRHFHRNREMLENLELGKGVKGVYVSIDIDCLDPAFAPGVSHIEPGGLSFRDVMNILQNLKGNVVAGDVVELNPQRDTVDGMTAMVAAKFVRELAARISK